MTWLFESLERRLAQGGETHAIDAGIAGTISYARLRHLTGALAERLAGTGPVAILANRSAEAYLSVIACFRAGRSFVPLNPTFPLARLSKIAERSGAALCLFDPQYEELAEQIGLTSYPVMLSEDTTSNFQPDFPSQSDVVYQLFTSGSTGQPKGVPVRHGALCHYVAEIISAVGIKDEWRATQFFDLSFDLAMHDIFVTLATGGTIVPASSFDLMMPHRFVEKNQIDIWFSVPLLALAAARGQLAKPEEPRLRKALFCGEALPGEYVAKMQTLMRPGGDIWNLYGPTEATIAFTAHRCDERDCQKPVVPLGIPFGDNQIAALVNDTIMPLTQVNENEGELLLAGPQLFSGYEPTTESSPFVTGADGQFYYRTGDLVRMVEGDICYLGRIGSQVKIRGHRVELGEIEQACCSLEEVDAAVAVLAGDNANPVIMIAYQGRDGADFTHLSATLPEYMLPRECRRFELLPTNSNGKLDRNTIRQKLCANS